MSVEVLKRSETIFSHAPAASFSLRVCVIIPVRNEEDHILNALHSLMNQRDVSGYPLDQELYEVLVLANNCTDRSAELARDFSRQFPRFQLYIDEITVTNQFNNIGYVRGLLMDTAFNRARSGTSGKGIIASTDGDTTVSETWIYNIIQEIDNGNDAVGGRIYSGTIDRGVRPYYLRDVMYRTLMAKLESRLDPGSHNIWPSHFQYYAANLAVTCEAYLKAGKLPSVSFLEDNALQEALHRVDARVRKSYKVVAHTSGRENGRVEIGFSEQLQKWSSMSLREIAQMVEDPAITMNRIRQKARLRVLHASGVSDLSVINGFANENNLSADWLCDQLECQTYFGELWEGVRAKCKTSGDVAGSSFVRITDAIEKLRKYLNK